MDRMGKIITKFHECLHTWIDLPKYVYTEKYEKAFVDYIERRINYGLPVNVAMILHHETEEREPYLEFDR